MHSYSIAMESFGIVHPLIFLAVLGLSYLQHKPYRKGNKLIAGAMDTINLLRTMSKKIFFVTNNSTKSRKGCLDKFTSLGLKVHEEGITIHSFLFLSELLAPIGYSTKL